jgi:hypothetical protein
MFSLGPNPSWNIIFLLIPRYTFVAILPHFNNVFYGLSHDIGKSPSVNPMDNLVAQPHQEQN